MSNENEMPKKRGRKLGVKVGPRPTVWACAAMVGDELILEQLQAPGGSDFETLESFSAEDAKEAFAELHDLELDEIVIAGPFHAKKGGNHLPIKKRETVTIPLPNLTNKRETAIYRGWKGVAYGIEGREDVVYFMFGEEVSPNSDRKKNPPTAKTIFRTVLEFPEIQQSGN